MARFEIYLALAVFKGNALNGNNVIIPYYSPCGKNTERRRYRFLIVVYLFDV